MPCRRFLTATRAREVPIGSTMRHPTVSIGVNEAGPDAAASILRRADAALHAAEPGGRDQVGAGGFAPPGLQKRRHGLSS